LSTAPRHGTFKSSTQTSAVEQRSLADKMQADHIIEVLRGRLAEKETERKTLFEK
jgi:hypothetical protein